MSFSKTSSTPLVYTWAIKITTPIQLQAVKVPEGDRHPYEGDFIEYCLECGRVADYCEYGEDGWETFSYCREHWLAMQARRTATHEYHDYDKYRFDNWYEQYKSKAAT